MSVDSGLLKSLAIKFSLSAPWEMSKEQCGEYSY